MNIALEKQAKNKQLFASRLSELMEARDVTKYQISQKTTVSADSISMYLSGKQAPTIINLLELCKLFNVDPNYFLGYETVGKKKLSPLAVRSIKVIDGL